MDLGAEMAACAYPTKSIDWARLARVVALGRAKPEAAALRYVFEVNDPERIVTRQGFAKARSVGTGFLMIQRSALEQLCAAHPELRSTAAPARVPIRSRRAPIASLSSNA